MGFLLRWLGRTLLLLYVLLAIVVVGIRYWLLPSIDAWKEPISQVISHATNSHIEIGRLQASWVGLRPEIIIHKLQVLNEKQEPQLEIPYLQATLKWQSLLQGKIHFSSLHIDGLALSMWRDTDLALHIAGQQLNEQPGVGSKDHGFFTWLAQQDQLVLHRAKLIWRDFSRHAPELIINDLNGVVQARADDMHFSLSALPPANTASKLELRGHFNQSDLLNDLLSGQVYVEFTRLHPAQWRQWVDALPSDLVKAQMNAQFWLEIKNNRFEHVTVNSELEQAEWALKDGSHVSAAGLRFFIQGQWEQIHAFFTQDKHVLPANFLAQVVARNLSWADQKNLAAPLSINSLELALAPDVEDPSRFKLQHLYLLNRDAELSATGSIRLDKKNLAASFLDVQAQIKKVALSALYKYFPKPFISDSTIEWLQQSLLSGQLSSGQVRWLGKLEDYPFKDPSTGIFFVGGQFTQTSVDYYPSTVTEKGWPAVQNANGYLSIRGNELWIKQGKAQLHVNEKAAIEGQLIQVHIDDFSADEPWLEVQAVTQGAAQSYLGLMASTDLGAWLGHHFDQSSATGTWQVPLGIRINLEDVDQVSVKGHIEFQESTVQLMPELAPFEAVTGKLLFTEKQAEAHDVVVKWLGGRTRLQGIVGPKEKSMQLKGEIRPKAALHFYGLAEFEPYLQGQIGYQANVGFDVKDEFFITLTSSLEGLSSRFPSPLTKSSTEPLALTAKWHAYNDKQHALHLELGSYLQLQLVESARKTPFFEKGALGWRQPAQLPEKTGLVFDINEAYLDLGQWQQVLSVTNTSTPHHISLLPDLHRVRVKANTASWQDNKLNNFTYTLHHIDKTQWRSDLSSDQIAGTVFWEQDQAGAIQGAIQIDLQRLHWQQSKSQQNDSVEKEADFELDLPDIDIRIADLRLNEWNLGALRAHGRQQEKHLWHIPVFTLQNPHGEFNASGHWRLKGVGRGLKLSSQWQSTEIGRFLDYLGAQGIMGGGQGAIQAQLFWRDFPWKTSIKQIEAELDVSLHEGRLYQIHSRTAKLLELLSLQSLSRLASFNLDLRSLTKDGFPFSDMKGQLWIDQQVLYTKNFRVVGPVGTIVLEGKTDLIQEQINMEALVVPNVDMSGAAIAAGIALNPVVGLSAFITQLLFKEPLARAMTVRYGLSGPWDQIEMKEIQLKNQGPE